RRTHRRGWPGVDAEALSFHAIPDGKPVPTFPGIASELGADHSPETTAEQSDEDQPADNRVRLEECKALVAIVDVENADLTPEVRSGSDKSGQRREGHLGGGKSACEK